MGENPQTHQSVETLFREINSLLRAEGRPAADETALFLGDQNFENLTDCKRSMPFESELRSLLEQSALPIAQAVLNAWDYVPWGNNPVAGGPAQPIFAVASLLGDNAAFYTPNYRLGFYYQTRHSYYGLHSHRADETYTIIAGSAHWTAADITVWRRPGDVIHHPSLTPHAFRTGREGFLALWRWSGDVSIDSYQMIDDPLAG